MVVGAFAELASLGAVLPFLAVVSDPTSILRYEWLHSALEALHLSSPTERLQATTALFCVGALTASAIRVALGWASSRLVYMLGHDLTLNIYSRIVRQPYSFFVSRNSSELIAAFNNVQLITGRVLLALMNLLTASALSAFILAALLIIDAGTAMIAGLGFAGIYLAVSHGVRRRLRENSVTAAGAQGKRVQCFQEAIGGIRNVLLDDTQPLYIEKLRAIDVPLRNAEAATALISVAPRYLVEAGSMVLIALIAYGLTSQSGAVGVVLPTLGALALGAQKLLPLLQQIYLGWVAAASNWAVLADVLDLLELPVPEEYGVQEAANPIRYEMAIELRGVSFRYNTSSPMVLRDIDLTIKKGTRCGIIGRSGGGKSTLIDVVMGLLPPSSGKLLVDGTPIVSANRRSWQARIAHVPQTIYLADASIAENIALGIDKRAIDMERVRYVARQARVAEFVEADADGYDAFVGERGIRLSGGQRQRIAIARALYKRADVLILDEATSALDDETERAVVECIDGLDQNLTVLIIAHRLSTLRNCDQVVRLDSGTLADRGVLDELVTLVGGPDEGASARATRLSSANDSSREPR